MLDQAGAVLRRLEVSHTVAGLRRLVAAIAEREPRASAVLVAIERPDGLLVEALLEAGYTLYALNPKAVERYRDRTSSPGAKTGPADAELLARILLTDRDRHLPWRPSRPEVAVIRAIARDDERASRDQRWLLNRLREDLLTVFPQALEAFADLGASTALAFLARWPTAAQAQLVGPDELAAFLREQRHGWPQRAAMTIRAALAAEVLAASTSLVQAKAGSIQLAAQQLLLPHPQRGVWRKQLEALLEGDGAQPDGEVLLSMPGLNARLAARVLGNIGDRRERFPTPAALQCYAGTAPVTKTPGRRRVVAARLAWIASSARHSSTGRCAHGGAQPGGAPPTTASAPTGKPTTRHCVHSPTAGLRSSTTS